MKDFKNTRITENGVTTETIIENEITTEIRVSKNGNTIKVTREGEHQNTVYSYPKILSNFPPMTKYLIGEMSYDDKQIVSDEQDMFKSGSWTTIYITFSLVAALTITHSFEKNKLSDVLVDKFMVFFFIFLYVLPLLILLFNVFYLIKMPKKVKILDRENGMFTFPGKFWARHTYLPFHKVCFTISNPMAGGIGVMLVAYERGRYFSSYVIGSSFREALSYNTWYMDKNRPLPPGDAFDEYRQQDFERRKAEGFPKPLYPTQVPTPEATSKQQAERERIGGW